MKKHKLPNPLFVIVRRSHMEFIQLSPKIKTKWVSKTTNHCIVYFIPCLGFSPSINVESRNTNEYSSASQTCSMLPSEVYKGLVSDVRHDLKFITKESKPTPPLPKDEGLPFLNMRRQLNKLDRRVVAFFYEYDVYKELGTNKYSICISDSVRDFKDLRKLGADLSTKPRKDLVLVYKTPMAGL